jgi:magnesium and cobalt transporter
MASDTAPKNKNSLVNSLIKQLHKKAKADKKKDSTKNGHKLIYENINKSKRDMIKGILELSEHNAREIMIPRVDTVAVQKNISLKELIKIVYDAGHSRIPVFEDTIDNIAGILYVKDLLNFIIEKPKKFVLKKLLHKPLFIPETMPLDELLFEFKKKRQHLAIVVDEYGGVAGMVTMEDILEEIVGEINDEFDEKELPEIVKISKNNYEIDSRMSIDNLNNELNIALPSEEFDTVSGLIFDLFGRIPKKDEVIEYNDMTFKVIDIKGTRLNRIRLSLHVKK